MLNFKFHNPTHIVFGKDTVASLDELIPPDARVMILYGGQSAERNGTLADVRAALGARFHQEFGGIEANPTYETLIKAVALARDHAIDFLLAVGGGSVIDGTKFVAGAIPFNDDPWKIIKTGGGAITTALPYGVVLTLAATGSEMNCGGAITRVANDHKGVFNSPLVYPRFSVLDPTRTYTLPPRQLANGVADAFVHVVEQYLTYPVGARVQDRFAEGLMRTLIEIGPDIVDGPADYEARANLMWSATMALNGLIGAGVPHDWATHTVGLELTALYDIDHAATLAILLAAMLRLRVDGKRAKLLQYADRVWDITEGDDDTRIESAIQRTVDFFEQLGIKTRLADYGLGVEAVDAVISQLQAHGLTALGEHGEVTLEVSRQALAASL